MNISHKLTCKTTSVSVYILPYTECFVKIFRNLFIHCTSFELLVLICDDPPDFSNASYNKQIWYNGTQANYTCEPGYMHASDSNIYLTCEVVGYDVEWSKDSIKCVPGSSFRKSWLEQLQFLNIYMRVVVGPCIFP